MIHCWAHCMQPRTLETRKTLANSATLLRPTVVVVRSQSSTVSTPGMLILKFSKHWKPDKPQESLPGWQKFHFVHSHTLLTFKQKCMRQVRKTLKIMLCSKRLPSFPTEWNLCPSDPPSVLLPPQPASSPALGARSFTSCPHYQARPLFSNL